MRYGFVMVPVRKTDYKVLLKIPFVVANTVKEKDSVGGFISFQMPSFVVLNRSQIRAQHTGQILSRKGHLTFLVLRALAGFSKNNSHVYCQTEIQFTSVLVALLDEDKDTQAVQWAVLSESCLWAPVLQPQMYHTARA